MILVLEHLTSPNMKILAVSPRRAGGGSKTEQIERYGFASFSGLNV